MCISIHAPHTRSDDRWHIMARNSGMISIHAPHTRSDASIKRPSGVDVSFQSTLLIRGATRLKHLSLLAVLHFNPRSSYEERLRGVSYSTRREISIHAPHTRSDAPLSKKVIAITDFNPRSSYEERQYIEIAAARIDVFQSTLLIRGATRASSASIWTAYFNPRSSYEERHGLD